MLYLIPPQHHKPLKELPQHLFMTLPLTTAVVM